MIKQKEEKEWQRKIRATRKSCGLTQRQFARLIGISFSTMQFWEKGRSDPHPLWQSTLQKIDLTIEQGRKDDLVKCLSEHADGKPVENLFRLFVALGEGEK